MERGDFSDVLAFYARRGIGQRLGFGRSPAVLVVDFIRGFTDAASPLGSDLEGPVARTCEVLEIARECGIPIAFTTVEYEEDGADAGIWPEKAPAALTLVRGCKWVELDPRLSGKANELIVVKKFASAFFGTSLVSFLIKRGIDTLILTGCTTSGCIRATAVDALQYGYRAIVPEECVGDRAELPHRANLFDIDAKYGDVVPVCDVLGYLSGIQPGRA